MTQITGGKVSFRRVVQPAQYESKEGIVELTFSVDEGDGDKASGFLDSVAELAQHKALALVGLKPSVADEAKKVLAAVASKPKPAETKEQAAAKMNAKEAEKKPEPKPEPKKAEAKPVVDEFDTPPQITTNPEDRKPPVDELDEIEQMVNAANAPPKEITDVELRDQVNAWVAKHKDAKVVKDLRAKYAGPAAGLVAIPQEKRQAFLDELNAAIKTA